MVACSACPIFKVFVCGSMATISMRAHRPNHCVDYILGVTGEALPSDAQKCGLTNLETRQLRGYEFEVLRFLMGLKILITIFVSHLRKVEELEDRK